MAKQYIKIRGANEHNLKHISLDIPRNELVVLTGLSGSGKSSLAFDMSIMARSVNMLTLRFSVFLNIFVLLNFFLWFVVHSRERGCGQWENDECLRHHSRQKNVAVWLLARGWRGQASCTAMI